VSFLSQLFNRHADLHAREAPSTVNWAGQSGAEYKFTICPLHTEFKPLPGVYIYAHLAEDESWVPIYISQTRDLHQRLEGSLKPDEAAAKGATHLHAHYSSVGQAARCTEERDLIQRWLPVCNEPLES
jgi:hypothetical protein